MIYHSNLVAPDLTPSFKHLTSRVMGHSFGHDVLSDWADKADDDPVFGIHKRCGLWTHDEAALLYNVAKQIGGDWLDIGAHTGWTARHLVEAEVNDVWGVDPLYAVDEFRERAQSQCPLIPSPYTSRKYFADVPLRWTIDGVVIDGDHEPGEPLHDAMHAAAHLKPGGVILLHDFVGLPVREAVQYLMFEKGMRVRLYLTPHVVAVCWWRSPLLPNYEGPLGVSVPSGYIDVTSISDTRQHGIPGLSLTGLQFRPRAHRPDPFIVSQDLPARWPELDWRPFIAPEPE